jgi:hypothetical protein
METTGKVFIHIGLHKTATTYLQYQFFPAMTGVRYIHGSDFFKQWQSQSGDRNKKLLLSYEGFSGLAWNRTWLLGARNDFHWLDSFVFNIESLKLFFPDATLIVFFRRHGDLLVSMYKQYIQEGGVLSLNSFFGDDCVITPNDLSFRVRIELIKKLFPNSFFINYEEYKAIGDDYLKTFFSQELNIHSNLRPVNNNNIKSNNSITGLKIEWLRTINKYYGTLPIKVKSGLRYVGWSPRDIFQERLDFWKPADPAELQILREKVNDERSQDWDYFLANQWCVR